MLIPTENLGIGVRRGGIVEIATTTTIDAGSTRITTGTATGIATGIDVVETGTGMMMMTMTIVADEDALAGRITMMMTTIADEDACEDYGPYAFFTCYAIGITDADS